MKTSIALSFIFCFGIVMQTSMAFAGAHCDGAFKNACPNGPSPDKRNGAVALVSDSGSCITLIQERTDLEAYIKCGQLRVQIEGPSCSSTSACNFRCDGAYEKACPNGAAPKGRRGAIALVNVSSDYCLHVTNTVTDLDGHIQCGALLRQVCP